MRTTTPGLHLTIEKRSLNKSGKRERARKSEGKKKNIFEWDEVFQVAFFLFDIDRCIIQDIHFVRKKRESRRLNQVSRARG